MRILISGASGLVGRSLAAAARERGFSVARLVRDPHSSTADSVFWDPEAGKIALDRLAGHDAVVHLAGESIMGRWTDEKKRRIRDSRVQGTEFLVESLGRVGAPRAFFSASATGYYGDRGDETLSEDAPAGEGFLAGICRQWEAAAGRITEHGTRAVMGRIGMVLSGNGGALPQMLPLFRLGLGGRLGSGQQYMSWIALDDLIRAILFLLENEQAAGPVNLTSPHPETNRRFTQALARQVRRPAWFPAPAPALRLALGEMARELLLCSARVVPGRLQSWGFDFTHPRLEDALRWALTR